MKFFSCDGLDSNQRSVGYEPTGMTTSPPRDQIVSQK